MKRKNIEKLRIIIVRRNERGYAAAAHLFAMIPLWGFLFLLMLFFGFREKSREVVFHVKQAIYFMGLSLFVYSFYIICKLLIKLTGFINEDLSSMLGSISDSILYLVLGVYVLICLVAMISVYLGKPFLYPIVGKKVLKNTQPKDKSYSM